MELSTDISSDTFADRLTRLVAPAGWAVEGSDADPWLRAVPPAATPGPSQGWKLHLSASDSTAETVLERAVPVLIAADVSFKIASNRRRLAMLNQGEAGFSQIGKFVTVYPADEVAAVDLARRLDVVLGDLFGPTVPSDRALREHGVVSYRYGGFAGRWVQSPHGELTPAIETPDGDLIADTRLGRHAVPPWLDDPFDAAGLVHPRSPLPSLIGDRFRVLTTIHRSPRGSVHLGVDLRDVRRCVLKQAVVDGEAWGPAARLAHEHEVLVALADVPAVVGVIDWIDEDRERVLVLEDIDGLTLMETTNTAVGSGFRLDPTEVVRIGRELADAVVAIHARGIIHRDIKPTNVLLQPDGRVRLIDLELALTEGVPPRGYGTIGYVAPDSRTSGATHPADDVYAIGATLYVAATGAEMSSRPLLGALAQPIQSLAPEMPDAVAAVIERCMRPLRADRFRDAAELLDALDGLGPIAPVPPKAYGRLAEVPSDATERAGSHARRLADALCADAIEVPGHSAAVGVAWVSRHPASPGMAVRDVNTGVAGGLLSLAAIAEELHEDAHRNVVASAAAWLDAAPRPEGDLLGGLYVGEGGVAAALMRAGLLLGDQALIDSARQRSRDISLLPHRSPDLFNGSAGRARVHLWLAEALDDGDALDAARAAAAHLIANVTTVGPGRVCWELPSEFGGGRQLGYAHGTAGIADVLLDVAEITGDDAALATALAASRWLIDQARPLHSGAVAWPLESGERSWAPLWCHGSVGIGRLLVHLERSGLLEPADRWLLAATGVAAARLGRSLGPVACHGLAGSIDHLLDVHQVDPTGGHLAEAWSLAELLETFHVESADGLLRCSSERPEICSPDLNVGYAGVAAVWLRVARPHRHTLLAGRASAEVRT
jgi:hypothetical protein